MWLAGMQRPDHQTINRFRSERLRDVIGKIFSQVVLMVHEEGLLDIKTVFTDGTKIEANANRYTFVWGNAIKKSKERISKQLKELWDYAGSVVAAELGSEEPDFTNPDPEKVIQTLEKINRNLKHHRKKAKDLLTSEEGILKRKQRATDVEPVFGHLKYNNRMGRFLLKGKEKIEIETGLLAIAHNLAKKAG
ncbi:Transposase DDE domain-containing protein [Algoriphagus alkaliphilus]|uniref:Transposase DDE domain-containing protein n=2 Tax=Algoriphagus alkaliphilus TaxID=279824 RepID=A0A1G5X001_9BACT|nr:Transposase DDE domain-containing protein [Algoriphagus alkaliphilus]